MRQISTGRVRTLLRRDSATGELYRYRPYARVKREACGRRFISIDGCQYKAAFILGLYEEGNTVGKETS